MKENYSQISQRAISKALDTLSVAARTAPKTRGRDKILIQIVSGKDKEALLTKMETIAEKEGRQSFARDARSLSGPNGILLIGVENSPMDLNCGFCGYKSCKELVENCGVCAFNSMDLGIALGSAVSAAARLHFDNRLMFSLGKAAMDLGFMEKKAVQAIGIPLSATGKNPYFDRS